MFVDLFKVVRNGLRASRPGYGLKEMETFLEFRRHAAVRDGGTSIVIPTGRARDESSPNQAISSVLGLA